jgi:diketogulonate reductase-like aldo/keto reductase
MTVPDDLRFTKVLLNNGSEIPALGFGTLIPDPTETKKAVKAALEAGFRQFDCAERYRNEKEVGEAMREAFREGKIKREELFVGTKLWNSNHRPERVKPAFEADPLALSPGPESRQLRLPISPPKGLHMAMAR